MLMSRNRRIKHLETKISKPSDYLKQIQTLLKYIDFNKSIMMQVKPYHSIDAIVSIVRTVSDKRNPYYEELLNKDELSNDDYKLLINGNYDYLKEDEEKFINAYEKQFNDTFFYSEESASKNYLEATLNNRELLLDIELKDFEY